MSVVLLRPYGNYTAGTSLSLPSDVETALITQGIAASTSASGDQTLIDGSYYFGTPTIGAVPATSSATEKANVDFLTPSNDTLSGLAARDGITPTAGMRALVPFQTNGAANGIYVVASGAWTRASDADVWSEFPNSYVFVESGTTYGNTIWVNANDLGGVLGTTTIVFSQATGSGATGGIPLTGSSAITGTLGHTTTAYPMKWNVGGGIATQAPTFNFGVKNFVGLNPGAPVGETDDTVATFGWNMQAGNGRLDTTKPALGISLENNYRQNGKQQFEAHITMTDTGGTERRGFSWSAPRDGSTGSGMVITTDVIQFTTFATPQVVPIQFNMTGSPPNISLSQSTIIRQEVNNIAHRQSNAAGTTTLALPFIDSSDRLHLFSATMIYLDGPVTIAGALTLSGAPAFTTMTGPTQFNGNFTLQGNLISNDSNKNWSVTGNSQSQTNALLELLNTYNPGGVVSVPLLNSLAPNLQAGGSAYSTLGVAASSKNRSATAFTYVGSGSDSNRWGISFFGGNNLLEVFAGGQTLIGGAGTLLNATDRFQVSGAVTSSASQTAHSATAIPAGGTAGAGHLFSSTANFGVFFGSGAPTLSAAKGSLYLRSDGSTTNDRAYINSNGTTTWTALTTAA